MSRYVILLLICFSFVFGGVGSLFDYKPISSTVSQHDHSADAIQDILSMEQNNEKILAQTPPDLKNLSTLNQLQLIEHEKHIFSLQQTRELFKIKSEIHFETFKGTK